MEARPRLTFRLLPDRLAVCRLSARARVPAWLPNRGFVSLTRTTSELSIVCAEESVPARARAQRGFCAFSVEGTLDFSLVGVLSDITSCLARAGISVFAVSTYDTDYVLVRGESVAAAMKALRRMGHRFRRTKG